MVRLSHHLFHSFAPIVLLTAYLVTLLAFLAPTPILANHVYLMHVSVPVSAMAVTPGRHYIVGGGTMPRKDCRKQGMTKVAKRGPSVMVPVAIELEIGPLGACYTNVTSGGQECQSPSFTPIFAELYDDLSIPSTVVDTLTAQFPFSPTFLFISICLMFIQLLIMSSLAFGMHKPQGNLAFIARKQHRIVRVALIIGSISLVLGLAATGILRGIIGSDVKAAQNVQGITVTADIGSGFAQLWAGYILQLVVVLLLVAEFFATRPGRRKPELAKPDMMTPEGKAAEILGVATPTARARSPRPNLQLATPPPTARAASLFRAPSPARPSNPLRRTPSVARRPPSPASTPSTASTPSPTLYRPPYARLSASPPSAKLPWAVTSRSPSPTLQRSRPPESLLEVHGDSFCGVFTLLGTKCTVKRYSGASARGLANPQSTRQVAPRLIDRLESARPRSVLLMFGGVDFAINFLWQLKARGAEAVGPDDWVKKVHADYTDFLSTRIVPLARTLGMRVYIAGVLPPVVEDPYLEAAADKYISKSTTTKLLPLTYASHPHDLATRTAMVRRYNSMLASYCSRHQDCLSFVDISRELIDPRDPLYRVAPEYRDPEDETNIHLLWETTLPSWMRALPPLAPYASQMSSPPALSRLDQSLARFRDEKRERVSARRLS
ncbi:hypothetical protein JCM10908_003934 [Rhodotorula pacifica]|uniref:uncharacterized protein n=1 Tax=Rhodotorula pacifica TaxID=1495444 RepID=UPI0031732FA1